MKATLVETFPWSKVSRMRGFRIDDLPGMLVVDLDDVHASIRKEIERYATSYHQVFFKPRDNPDAKLVVDYTTTGEWANTDADQLYITLCEAVECNPT